MLVNASGHTLYLFTTDKQSTSTCMGACLAAWPGLTATGQPTGGAGVTSSLLGTVRDTNGTVQVTYNKWPLYTFVGDSAAGEAKGQGAKTFGGIWWVVDVHGTAVTTTASSSAPAGGGGY